MFTLVVKGRTASRLCCWPGVRERVSFAETVTEWLALQWGVELVRRHRGVDSAPVDLTQCRMVAGGRRRSRGCTAAQRLCSGM